MIDFVAITNQFERHFWLQRQFVFWLQEDEEQVEAGGAASLHTAKYFDLQEKSRQYHSSRQNTLIFLALNHDHESIDLHWQFDRHDRLRMQAGSPITEH